MNKNPYINCFGTNFVTYLGLTNHPFAGLTGGHEEHYGAKPQAKTGLSRRHKEHGEEQKAWE